MGHSGNIQNVIPISCYHSEHWDYKYTPLFAITWLYLAMIYGIATVLTAKKDWTDSRHC